MNDSSRELLTINGCAIRASGRNRRDQDSLLQQGLYPSKKEHPLGKKYEEKKLSGYHPQTRLSFIIRREGVTDINVTTSSSESLTTDNEMRNEQERKSTGRGERTAKQQH